jgi:hypothetical protein
MKQPGEVISILAIVVVAIVIAGVLAVVIGGEKK